MGHLARFPSYLLLVQRTIAFMSIYISLWMCDAEYVGVGVVFKVL